MGVPKIWKTLFQKNFKWVIGHRIKGFVSSLLVDMNGIIHVAFQETYQTGNYTLSLDQRNRLLELLEEWKIKQLLGAVDKDKIEEINEKYEKQKNKILKRTTKPVVIKNDEQSEIYLQKFRKHLKNRLNELHHNYSPRDLMVIAVDGVVPQAKMIQQRTRRFRGEYKKNQPTPSWITPGTKFMEYVDKIIREWIREEKLAVHTYEIKYSSHNIPGEGEHKIMDLIREGYIPRSRGAHVVLGLDADLIMLSLLAPINNIQLVRIMNPFDYHYTVTDVVYIDVFRKALENIKITPEDFVIISLFLGNDFLPHHPSLHDYERSINHLINAHKNISPTGKRVSIVEDGEINYQRLYHFLHNMAEREPDLIEKDITNTYDHPRREYDVPGVKNIVTTGQTTSHSLNFEQYRNAWYSKELSPQSDLEKDAILYKLVMKEPYEIQKQDINDMCKQYLTGIAWIFNYYTKGEKAVRWDWFYPYHHVPLFQDLRDKMDQVSGSLVPIIGWNRIRKEIPFYPIHQLLNVIPLKGNYLIPEKYRKYQKQYFPDYFPTNVLVEMDGLMGRSIMQIRGKKVILRGDEWMSVLVLPFTDPDRIMGVVNVSSEDIEKYTVDPETDDPYQILTATIIPKMAERRVTKPEGNKTTYKQRGLTDRNFYDRGRGRGRGGGDRGRGGRGSDRGRGRGGDLGRGGRGSDRGRGKGRGGDRGRGGRGRGSDRGRGRGGDRGRGGRGRGSDRGRGRGRGRGGDRGRGSRRMFSRPRRSNWGTTRLF